MRCIKRKSTDSSQISDGVNAEGGEMVSALEITNVDSVDKVYRILTEHMKLGVSSIATTTKLRHCFPNNVTLVSLSLHIRMKSIPKPMNACDATSRVVDIWRKRTHLRLFPCSIKP